MNAVMDKSKGLSLLEYVQILEAHMSKPNLEKVIINLHFNEPDVNFHLQSFAFPNPDKDTHNWAERTLSWETINILKEQTKVADAEKASESNSLQTQHDPEIMKWAKGDNFDVWPPD